MTSKRLCVIGLLALLTVGCKSIPKTTYSEWRSNDSPPKAGQVGVLRRVGGIDVWAHGDPDLPYVVVALLEQNFPYDRDYVNRSEPHLAEAARDHKADAIVLRGTVFTPKGAFAEWTGGASGGVSNTTHSGAIRIGNGGNCYVTAYAIKYQAK